MDKIFRDMQKKGLVSTGRQKINLSKLTLYQAICVHFLSMPTADVNHDYWGWQDFLRANRN